MLQITSFTLYLLLNRIKRRSFLGLSSSLINVSAPSLNHDQRRKPRRSIPRAPSLTDVSRTIATTSVLLALESLSLVSLAHCRSTSWIITRSLDPTSPRSALVPARRQICGGGGRWTPRRACPWVELISPCPHGSNLDGNSLPSFIACIVRRFLTGCASPTMA